MLHITCDLCGKEVCPADEHHYVVKIEAYSAQDPATITEADLDEDHLETISQMLREMEEDPAGCTLPAPTRNFRYDLCADCHQKFVNDPLGRAQLEKLDFSKN